MEGTNLCIPKWMNYNLLRTKYNFWIDWEPVVMITVPFCDNALLPNQNLFMPRVPKVWLSRKIDRYRTLSIWKSTQRVPLYELLIRYDAKTLALNRLCYSWTCSSINLHTSRTLLCYPRVSFHIWCGHSSFNHVIQNRIIRDFTSVSASATSNETNESLQTSRIVTINRTLY